MMRLEDIIKGTGASISFGEAGTEISAICSDSRKAAPGSLFIAVKGCSIDGHDFIDAALKAGAAAVVSADRKALALCAANFYGHPSEKLKLVGITGTNGKTTTVTLLYRLFMGLGYNCGLLSTIANYVGTKCSETANTTADPITINSLMSEMVEAGCEYCFMEVSSIGVEQERVTGLKFACGIFSNLTHDHLDYHRSFAEYLRCKKLFFDNLPATAFAITNADDKNGMVMVQNTKAQVKTYSVQSPADFKAKIIECHFEGMYLEINGREVGVQFIGKFNVSNLLAVYGAAVMLGKDPHEVLVALSAMHPVNGRFEALRSPSGYTAIVDYAHTPDALENVLNAIHGVLEGKGEVITVCGAGGNRDKGKRPLMAREAVKQSDRVIITSDNPRFEEPQDIINDMLAGLTEEDMKKVIAIVDRRQAIKTACMMAKPGDVILIAGKGHEDYQDVKGVKHHFDDKEEVRACF